MSLSPIPAGRPLGWLPLALVAATLPSASAHATEAAPYDLVGPNLSVTVTRGHASLPISQVPNLASGDKLEIRLQLPPDQSAEYMLVSAFLRGATNPPPKAWIGRSVARKHKGEKQPATMTLTVPEGARQLALFLLPDADGGFGTLSDTVRGKPGEFVRAIRELNQASLDRSRLDSFIATIRAQENTHPEHLRTIAPVLADSLSIKLNPDCLARLVDRQAACLVENRDSLVLPDFHTNSLSETLTGAPADLAFQISATREAGFGYYSPYIGIARDVARIFGAFSSPQLQYLPALGVQRDDTVLLLLNAAPSFRKPKSVLVTPMPAIEAEAPPPLRAPSDAPICVASSAILLPVEGAPLIYSTGYAHDMVARIKAKDGRTIDVPVVARADKGGFMLTGGRLRPSDFDRSTSAHLSGSWGFQRLSGPSYTLQFPQSQPWRVAENAPSLIVGRANSLSLQGPAASCVESVTIQPTRAQPRPAKWKVTGPDSISLDLPLDDARAGQVIVKVKQFGIDQPASLGIRAYAEEVRLDGIVLNTGEPAGVVTGRRLDEVRRVDLGGTLYRPEALTRDGDVDRLRIIAEDPGKARQPVEGETAQLVLRDGRTISLPVEIAAPDDQP